MPNFLILMFPLIFILPFWFCLLFFRLFAVLRYVEISYKNFFIWSDQNVFRFDISMTYSLFMEVGDTLEDLFIYQLCIWFGIFPHLINLIKHFGALHQSHHLLDFVFKVITKYLDPTYHIGMIKLLYNLEFIT